MKETFSHEVRKCFRYFAMSEANREGTMVLTK